MILAFLASIMFAGAQAAPVFLEWRAPETPTYRDQAVVLSLRLGVERAFLEQAMVQPFRRPLEFPLQLESHWDEELWRVRERKDPVDAALPRLVLDGVIRRADRVVEELRDGRLYLVAELDRVVMPRRAGALQVEAASVQYSWTEGGGKDLFGDPLPGVRQDARVESAKITLEVREWPEVARPEHFGGAIGSFQFLVEQLPSEGAEILRLRFTVSGEGNVESLEPPALEALAGFHLLGRIVERDPHQVQVVAEFALDAATPPRFPAIAFSFLDPDTGSYVTRVSESIPFAPKSLPAEAQDPIAPSEGFFCFWPLQWPIQVGLVVSAFAAGWWLQRKPRSARIQEAPPSQTPSDGASEPAASLLAFLSQQLGISEAEVHSPDLRVRISAHGIPAALCERTAALFDALQAERYGGPVVAQAAVKLSELRAEWQRHPLRSGFLDPPNA